MKARLIEEMFAKAIGKALDAYVVDAKRNDAKKRHMERMQKEAQKQRMDIAEQNRRKVGASCAAFFVPTRWVICLLLCPCVFIERGMCCQLLVHILLRAYCRDVALFFLCVQEAEIERLMAEEAMNNSSSSSSSAESEDDDYDDDWGMGVADGWGAPVAVVHGESC